MFLLLLPAVQVRCRSKYYYYYFPSLSLSCHCCKNKRLLLRLITLRLHFFFLWTKTKNKTKLHSYSFFMSVELVYNCMECIQSDDFHKNSTLRNNNKKKKICSQKNAMESKTQQIRRNICTWFQWNQPENVNIREALRTFCCAIIIIMKTNGNKKWAFIN